MYQVGIDIGSSAAKAAVLNEGKLVKTLLLDTGFSGRNTADRIYGMLEQEGITKENAAYVATGYGNGDETGRDDANELFTYQIG